MVWKLRGLGRVRILRYGAYRVFRSVFPPGRVCRILGGPLRGYKWFVAEGHQFWMPLGVYEQETARWLREQVREGDVVLDVGANAGYFTLLAASRVGARGRVVAFEPVPGNAEVVRKQCALNQCSVVTVESLAVGDRDGVATFVQEENNPNSHLADVRLSHASTRPVRKFDVQVTTLDSYLLDHSVAPDVVKVDVEGGEVGVLKGARDVLAARRTRWLVSTHSATLRSEVRRVFAEFGYSISGLPGFEHEVIAMP